MLYTWISPRVCLKWIEIVLIAIIFGLCLPGFQDYGGYTYIVIEALFCLIGSILFLVIIYWGHWWDLEEIFCYVACILNAISFGLGIYCCLVIYRNVVDPKVAYVALDWNIKIVIITICSGLVSLVYLQDIRPFAHERVLIRRSYDWRAY
jgi:hypothetical protein